MIFRANQWPGFYMIKTSVMKEFKAALLFQQKHAIIDVWQCPR